MKVHTYPSQQELIEAFANFFIATGRYYIETQGYFDVVLAGGGSPKSVYELLATPAYRDKIDWTKVYFFFGDERYVPADDPQYNGLMVEKALLEPLEISEKQVFKVNTNLPPEIAAADYMARIVKHFRKETIRFDLILLGLGDDAHTASLFPLTSVLGEKEAGVKALFLKKANSHRITMTAPLINQAKNIAFLVFGEKKAVAVQQVLKGVSKPEKFPAQLIKPTDGELHWFLDEKAAGFL